MKKFLIRIICALFIVGLIFCCACGDDSGSGDNGGILPLDTATATQKADTSKTPEISSEATAEPQDSDEQTGIIKKITGAADDTGIYSIVITLSDKAADKGVVEMVYNGPEGSPQENSVVCTFRIEYSKESNGKFEIKTFYNGDVYQNLHDKSEVKVENTFGAAVRGGNVVITYTPDGGTAQEVYRADADEFR